MHDATVGAAAVIAFWLFVAVAIVAGVIGDYKKRRIELEPLRAAIERGQPLDPALVERLMARPEHGEQRIDPMHLRLGGVIVVCVGVGVAILAACLRPLAPVAFLPILGGAALIACVGIGLWIGARIVDQHQRGGSAARAHPPASGTDLPATGANAASATHSARGSGA